MSDLEKVLEQYRASGRRVISVDFVLNALKGHYSHFEVTDESNIIPVKNEAQKGA